MRGITRLVMVGVCAAAGCGGGGGDPDATAADASGPDAEVVYDYCQDAPADYSPPTPATTYNTAFPGTVVAYPTENPYSWEKAILGKILFWEEQLSSDDTVACGTCHRTGDGGSDPRSAQPASLFPSALGGLHGAQGVRACIVDQDGEVEYTGQTVQMTKRKPPSYLDAMFGVGLFWDGRATDAFTDPDLLEVAIAAGGSLESQVVGPPVNDVEMACAGRQWSDIHAKLATVRPLARASNIPPDMLFALCQNPSYPELFAAAFGDSTINTRRIAFAIATHERTLLSNDTPWDRYQNGDVAAMTQSQIDGMNLFAGKGKCQRCHAPPVFGSSQFVNLGFINFDNPGGAVGTPDPHVDLGREEFTGVIEDRGKFRSATARNVGLRESEGILHDGIGDGATLDALMAAYNVPPARDAHTDVRMLPGDPANLLGLTDLEIAAMLDFMRTGLTDPRVAGETFPFDRPRLGTEAGSSNGQ
jgi:cytochrome c peroxidase